MTRLALAGSLALALTVGLVAQTVPLSKELTSLQGTWVLTEVDGQSMDASGGEVALAVTGDKYTETQNGQVVERGTIKLDGSKTPMTIDLLIAEGDDANKTQLGVIKIADDTVTGKLATPGTTTRPTDFAPADGFFAFVAKKRPGAR